MAGPAAKNNGYAPLPQTHYTISEDATAADLRNKLYAIAERKDFSEMLDPPLMGSSVQGRPGMPPAGIVHPETSNLEMVLGQIRRGNPPAGKVHPEAWNLGMALGQIGRGNPPQKSSRSYDMITRDTDDNSSVDQSPRIDMNLMERLMRRIRELEATNIQLQEHQKEEIQEQEVNIQVFHTIFQEDGRRDDSSASSQDIDQSSERGEISATFLSAPYWDVQDGDASLRSYHHVPDPRGYLKRKGNVSFVIYKCYDTAHQRKEVNEAIRNNEALPEPMPTSQEFMLISKDMIEAAKSFFDQDAGFRDEFPWFDEHKRMRPPFLWWYHYRRKLDVNVLRPRPRKLITELISWLESTYGSLYNYCETKFRKGLVSSTSLKYLIRPGTVLIHNKGNLSQGYLAKSHPVSGAQSMEANDEGQKGKFTFPWRLRVSGAQSMEANDDDQKGKSTFQWRLRVSSLAFNGELIWRDMTVKIDLVAESARQDVPITELNYIPLEYSSAEVKGQLEARGKQTFWRNLRGQLVSYESERGGNKSVRFMIDFRTYNELHPGATEWLKDMTSPARKARHYKPKDGQDPESPELYLFPSQTKGFNFRTKKWSTLDVDLIREVNWNNKAFGSLVADDDTKEMIQALVSNQLAAQKGTDLIESKGNGLILLLHGPPGTGKTYTAESVAEIARKPLYPVTCGDIGTEPEAVEKYLDSVFHLGKIWDCVVLLDEAEVFLEQRTLNDLKRNALVSVFLRTLEYYEGILILTTNRVGTFDEAFKSRISLALRYEKLTQVQRKQVWRNFIRRLEDLGEQESVDLEDLKLHIDELASYPMNGRQIRNSISTARQLALYKKTRMTSAHLRRSITLANKFDDYLGEVRMGELSNAEEAKKDGTLTDEYFAREDNIR